MVVVVATLTVVRLEIGISSTRVIDRIGEATRIRHVAVLLTLVGKERYAQLQYLVDVEVSLQRDVIAVVLYALHGTLFFIVACRCIVVGTVGATTDAGIILLVQYVAEQDVVPVGIDGAQVVDALLGSSRQGIPATGLVGIELAQFIEDIGHATLVFTIAVATAQQVEF